MTGRVRAERWWHSESILGLAFLFPIGYFLLAELSHALSFPSTHEASRFASFWMPAGWAFAYFLKSPTKTWPWLLLGTAVANLTSDMIFHEKSLVVSTGFWFANSIEVIVGVWATKTFLLRGQTHLLDGWRKVAGFVLVSTMLGTAIGAAIGAAVVTTAFGADYFTTWRIWWAGDAIGVLIIGAAVVATTEDWRRLVREPGDITTTSAIHFGLLIFTIIVFRFQPLPLAYAVCLFLVSLGMLQTVIGVAHGMLIIALVAVWSTANGHGPFTVTQHLPTQALQLQLYLAISSGAFMVFGAYVRERNRRERQHRVELETILNTLNAEVLLQDAQHNIVRVNPRVAEACGTSPEQLIGQPASDYYLKVDPTSIDDDRRVMATRVAELGVTRQLSLADGSTKHVRVDRIPIFELDDVATGLLVVIDDITDETTTDRELRKTFTSLRTATDAVFWVDANARIIYVNDAACRTLGYDEAELLTKTVVDINPRIDSIEQFQTQVWEKIETFKSLTFESAHQRADGRIYPVEISTHYMKFEADELVCSFVRDITDRVQAQQDLADAKTQLQLAVAGGNVGLWDWNVQENTVYFSAEWHQQLGEEPGTLQQLQDWESRVHPADVDGVMRAVEAYLQGSTENYTTEFRLRHADGTYRWILASGRASRDDQGLPVRFVGTHVDVTQRKRIELELVEAVANNQAMLELIGTMDGVWDWRVGTDQAEYAPAFRRVLGIDGDDLATLPNNLAAFENRLHPDDAEHTWAAVNEALVGHESFEHEFRLRHHDSHYIWVRGRGSTVYDEDGTPRRMAGSIYDITEQHEATEALIKERELLAQSNADLDRFASAASHDLQEPLRAVAGYCQLLKKRTRDKLDAKSVNYVDKAMEGAKRMQAMIADLLFFSRVAKEGDELSPVDLNQSVQQACESLAMSIQQHDAEIIFDDLPIVMGIGSQLPQLFQNLIGNAVKFCQQETPRISIRCHPDGERVRIDVEDNGIGIDPQHVGKIFRIFERVHGRGEYEGTGIGLAICQRIVERHGGTISVASELRQGTTFSFDLPLATTE